MSGMKLAGMSVTDGSASAVAVGGGTVVSVDSSSSATAYQCEMPRQEEICTVEAYRQAAAEKTSYHPGGRNVLIGIGYCVYIVPGLAMYWAFDSGRDGKIARANTVEADRLRSCRMTAAR